MPSVKSILLIYLLVYRTVESAVLARTNISNRSVHAVLEAIYTAPADLAMSLATRAA